MSVLTVIGAGFLGVAVGAAMILYFWIRSNNDNWEPAEEVLLDAWTTVRQINPKTADEKAAAVHIARKWWHAFRAALIAGGDE